jgi:hypothetical protein
VKISRQTKVVTAAREDTGRLLSILIVQIEGVKIHRIVRNAENGVTVK